MAERPDLGTMRGPDWQADEYERIMGRDARARQERAAKASKCTCAHARKPEGKTKGSHHHPVCAFYC